MYTVLPKKYGPCNLQQAIWEEICIKIKDFFLEGCSALCDISQKCCIHSRYPSSIVATSAPLPTVFLSLVAFSHTLYRKHKNIVTW